MYLFIFVHVFIYFFYEFCIYLFIGEFTIDGIFVLFTKLTYKKYLNFCMVFIKKKLIKIALLKTITMTKL